MASPSSSEPKRVDDDRAERFLELVVETELETGRRETTVEKAKRNIFLRIANVVGGLIVVGVGIAMLVLPGPGVFVIIIGLALLAPEVPFADRLLTKLKARMPQDADGTVSTKMLVVSGVVFVIFTGGSIWWAVFGRG